MIVITGATGNVGRLVTASLVSAGQVVTAVARGVSAALTGHRHLGQTYVLTGPEATTPRQRTQTIATAIKQHLTFVELSPHDARAEMLSFMPAPVADATLAILGHPTPEEARVNPEVEKILGRRGRSFADWAQRNATVFR
jgi:uncharacterized protein YbjT (DUF2867 family)